MPRRTLDLASRYYEALTQATEACTHLAYEVEEAHLCRRQARSLSDPHVARLCLIATLYKDILDGKGTGTDHQVWTSPHFGLFSTLDLVHLLEGSAEHSLGLATLDLPGYGTVMPTPQGWQMLLTNEYGEVEISPMEAETLHTLLTHAGTIAQTVPYLCPGVLPSPSQDWRAHLDGMSVVVVPQEFTRAVEPALVCEIREPIRLSMHYDRYAVLVWSVAYQRYGLEAFRSHHETTLSCFGESRLPRNALEAQYWMDVFTWRGWSEEERSACFLPGYPFAHLTKEAMGNITLYQKLVQSSRK